MPAKKSASAKAKGERAAARPRNPSGVSRVWGDGDGKGGNGQSGRRPRRRRNPAPEESEDIRRANELLLQVWQSIYSKRDKFGKFDRE
jgi:hypothetical protein